MDATQISTVAGFLRAMSKHGVTSIAEAHVYIATLQASEVDKKPKTLAQIVKDARLPFSTASRMAWDLSENGLLKYTAHPSDRRKKLLVAKNINGHG